MAVYPLKGGLFVCPSESFCFTVLKWRPGSATLVHVVAGSLSIASSALSLSLKWDRWSILVLSFLSFIPNSICWCLTKTLLSSLVTDVCLTGGLQGEGLQPTLEVTRMVGTVWQSGGDCQETWSLSQLCFLQTVCHVDVSAVTLLMQASACSLTRD